MTDEARKPFLIPTRNPGEMTVDSEKAAEDDLCNILSIFVQSTSLWFRVEFGPEGNRQAILPQDFINARTDSSGDARNTFLRDKAKLLKMPNSKPVITIINPRTPEKRNH